MNRALKRKAPGPRARSPRENPNPEPRDVNKITAYYALFAPQLRGSQYASEIWALYEAGDLHPDVALTGQFAEDAHDADVDGVLEEIKVAMIEEQNRQERLREENAA